MDGFDYPDRALGNLHQNCSPPLDLLGQLPANELRRFGLYIPLERPFRGLAIVVSGLCHPGLYTICEARKAESEWLPKGFSPFPEVQNLLRSHRGGKWRAPA